MDKASVVFVLFVLFKITKATNLYIDDDSMMVAFKCGRVDLFKEGEEWKLVEGGKDQKNCLKQADDILDLCQHVYPGKNIVNVAQMDYEVSIPHWCLRNDKSCKKHSSDPLWKDFYKSNATPWKCLNSSYEDKALPVPPTCHFHHISDMRLCTSSVHHVNQARIRCAEMRMNLNQQSPLKSCGLNMFLGIEFVCCPDTYYYNNNNNNVINNNNKGHDNDELSRGYRHNNGNFLTASHFSKHHTSKNQNDQVINPHHNKHPSNPRHSEPHFSGKKATRGSEVIDWYLRKRGDGGDMSEHEVYEQSKQDLASVYKERFKQLQRSWKEAQQRARHHTSQSHYNQLMGTINERFQKMVEADEVEHSVEQLQLSHLHEQQVAKRLQLVRENTFNAFSSLLDHPNVASRHPFKVVRALQRHIKALHKDRLHTIRHYNHTDPTYAETIRQDSASHISFLDRQLQQALSLLDRLPRNTKAFINKEIAKPLHAYHSVDASFMVKVEDDDDDDEFNVADEDEEDEDDEDSSDDDDDEDYDGGRMVKSGESVEETPRRMEVRGGRVRGEEDDDGYDEDGYSEEDDEDDDDDDDDSFSVENSFDGEEEDEDEDEDEPSFDSDAIPESRSLDVDDEEDEDEEDDDDGMQNDEGVEDDEDDEEEDDRYVSSDDDEEFNDEDRFENDDDDASDNDDDDDEENDEDDEEEDEDDDDDDSLEKEFEKEKMSKFAASEKYDDEDQDDVDSNGVDDDNDDDDDDGDKDDNDDGKMTSHLVEQYWKPGADSFKKNAMSMEQNHVPASRGYSGSHTNFGTAIPLGVTVGTLTVAVVIIVGVLVMQRRASSGYNKASSRSDLESPQTSPEEKHLASMQVNGYENPTYKYFERCQTSPPAEA